MRRSARRLRRDAAAGATGCLAAQRRGL